MSANSACAVSPFIRVYDGALSIMGAALKSHDVPTLVQFEPDPRVPIDPRIAYHGRLPNQTIWRVVEDIEIVSQNTLRILSSGMGQAECFNHLIRMAPGHWLSFEYDCLAFGSHGKMESGVIVPCWPSGCLD